MRMLHFRVTQGIWKYISSLQPRCHGQNEEFESFAIHYFAGWLVLVAP